jgi:cytochrome b6-f complex iron-sulfur subunit
VAGLAKKARELMAKGEIGGIVVGLSGDADGCGSTMREDDRAGHGAIKSEEETEGLSRRRFLVWLTRGALGAAVAVIAGQIVRFLSFQPEGGEPSVSRVGRPEDFAEEGLTYIAEARVYVGHDGGGLFALDAVCTHLGCLIEPAEMGRYRCPCHGSYFSPDGEALNGPATRPLRFLRLWLGSDSLMVDRDQQVGPAERLVL